MGVYFQPKHNPVMNTIYHSLIKAVALMLRPDHSGRHLPASGTPDDFHTFIAKVKSNADRFKR